MMQRNDPGNADFSGDQQHDPNASQSTPSWNNEPPPPTEPALPPIRSTTRPTAEASYPSPNYSGSSSRALVSAHESMRRDIAAASNDDPNRSLQSPTLSRAGDETIPPFIIPGDGKASAVSPTLRRRRPRSRAMQVALLSVTAFVFLALLFAATPLTADASNKLNHFVADSNVWQLPTPTPTQIPTPTPIPKPPTNAVGGGSAPNPGASAVMGMISSVFGPYASGALAVARCESGYDPNAWNVTPIMGSHAAGVFQILYPITWNNTAQAGKSPYDAYANIVAAHQIFSRDGNTWREWSCQP